MVSPQPHFMPLIAMTLSVEEMVVFTDSNCRLLDTRQADFSLI